MSETIKKPLTGGQLIRISGKIPRESALAFRQRAFVSLISAEIFSDYLEELGIKVSKENNLHSISSVLEEYDIADIMTEKGVTVDIRAVVGDEYPEMWIPKEHFETELQADFYAGIRIGKDLKEAVLTGFIEAKGISKEKENKNYYIVDFEGLKPPAEIIEAIKAFRKPPSGYEEIEHKNAMGLFVPFIDRTISKEDKKDLLKHLLGCSECRQKIKDIIKIDLAIKKEKNKALLDNDYTLRLFAGDPVLAGEEQTEINIEKAEEPEVKLAEEEQISVEEVHRPRDWADELTTNIDPEKPLKPVLDELTEVALKEEEVVEEVKLPELNLESLDSPGKKEKKPKKEDEDIFESFSDVEVIQSEEDIDNILSFFDSDEDKKQIVAETRNKSEEILMHADDLGYTSILKPDDKVNEETDFLIHDDSIPIQEIQQEDIFNLFDTDINEYSPQKTVPKKSLKSFIGSSVRDKNVIAFAAAIMLSTTVLFLYLGQINNQLQMANVPHSDDIDNNSNKNNSPEQPQKREREPMKTYSREIVRNVNEDHSGDDLKLVKNINNVTAKAYIPQAKMQEVAIKDLSWELSSDVAQDTRAREYFLEVGQILKDYLSKALYSPEIDLNSEKISIYAELDSKGNVVTSKVIEGTDHEKVDTLCLEVLNKIIARHHIPDMVSGKNKLKFQLLINF